ncbi:hypothetical protein QNH39_10055 [Neobacillus novalis]|uniref:Uncharacterized protein n=1 Tax=Neobacillus novalis TaxID=220687 RepID=A0AA95MQJ9_9BACI|nr:hypothetical protein [Neobacillus novalis]WHY88156.1 hypothetical protein QNH39_10055 [Neobacillus novalis]
MGARVQQGAAAAALFLVPLTGQVSAIRGIGSLFKKYDYLNK